MDTGRNAMREKIAQMLEKSSQMLAMVLVVGGLTAAPALAADVNIGVNIGVPPPIPPRS